MKLFKCIVEYRTVGGSSYEWEGYAEDKSDAESKALDESYESGSWDDFYHSTIYVDLYEDDFIENKESEH